MERQLWGVANVLRGKINADEYKNYILGFIFYKDLSEELEIYVDGKLLTSDVFAFAEIKGNAEEGEKILDTRWTSGWRICESKPYNGLSGKTAKDFGEDEPFVSYKQISDSGPKLHL